MTFLRQQAMRRRLQQFVAWLTQTPPLKAPELLAMGMKAAFLFGVGAWGNV
jgi:hypothetical protein